MQILKYPNELRTSKTKLLYGIYNRVSVIDEDKV